VKGTFEVCNLGYSLQPVVIMAGKIMAHHKISEKYTTQNPLILLDEV